MRQLAAVVVVLSASTSMAAGFALLEQNARSTGMAGAGVASSEGAATLFYNPGATAFEDGIAAEVSLLGQVPVFHARAGALSASTAAPHLWPTVFIQAPVMERLHLGLGIFSAFGIDTRWRDNAEQESSSSLRTTTVNPSVSVRITDDLGIGAGVDVTRGTVRLSQNFGSSSYLIDGGAFGVGGNVGVEVRAMRRKLRLGAGYRSATKLSFAGLATFNDVSDGGGTTSQSEQPVTTTWVMPHVLTAGAAYSLTRRTLLTAELRYTTWSNIDATAFEFEDGRRDTSFPQNWHNTLAAAVAAEHELSASMVLRVGAGFDPSPAPPGLQFAWLPNSTRISGSAGAAYVMGNFSFDAAYRFSYLPPRTETEGGLSVTFTGTAHVFALTASFRQ